MEKRYESQNEDHQKRQNHQTLIRILVPVIQIPIISQTKTYKMEMKNRRCQQMYHILKMRLEKGYESQNEDQQRQNHQSHQTLIPILVPVMQIPITSQTKTYKMEMK